MPPCLGPISENHSPPPGYGLLLSTRAANSSLLSKFLRTPWRTLLGLRFGCCPAETPQWLPAARREGSTPGGSDLLGLLPLLLSLPPLSLSFSCSHTGVLPPLNWSWVPKSAPRLRTLYTWQGQHPSQKLAIDPPPPPSAPGSLLTTPAQQSGTNPGSLSAVLALFCCCWLPAPSTEPDPTQARNRGRAQLEPWRGVVSGESSGRPVFACPRAHPGTHAHVVGVDEGDVFAAEVLHTVIHHVHQGRLPLVLPIQPWGGGEGGGRESRQCGWSPDTQLPADLPRGCPWASAGEEGGGCGPKEGLVLSSELSGRQPAIGQGPQAHLGLTLGKPYHFHVPTFPPLHRGAGQLDLNGRGWPVQEQ